MYSYRKARLADRKGDLSKRWYINFYAWDVQKNALVRRQYIDTKLNDLKSVSERRLYASILIKQINEYLKKGYNINRNARHINKKKEAGKTVYDAVNEGMELKRSRVKPNSINSISSVVKIFSDYLEKNELDSILLKDWGRADSILFVDYILEQRGVSGGTANKYIDYIASIFAMLEEREMIEENPWRKIRKQRLIRSFRNIAFTNNELDVLIPKLQSDDPELYNFVSVMYYTFMRPNEIRQLKVKHILIQDKKIYVEGIISKNNKDDFVEIPEPLLPTIQSVIRGKSSGEFIFQSQRGAAYGKNNMTRRHKDILDSLNFAEDHTLYSWKHTGVVMAYKSGIKIKSIQLQCRHYSITETDVYLKSLGLYDNEEIQLNMPGLSEFEK